MFLLQRHKWVCIFLCEICHYCKKNQNFATNWMNFQKKIHRLSIHGSTRLGSKKKNGCLNFFFLHMSWWSSEWGPSPFAAWRVGFSSHKFGVSCFCFRVEKNCTNNATLLLHTIELSIKSGNMGENRQFRHSRASNP
jgi:hypothetical protein